MEIERNVTLAYAHNLSTNASNHDFQLSQPVRYLLVVLSELCLFITFYLFVCVLIFIKRKSYLQFENQNRPRSKPISNTGVNSGANIGSPAFPLLESGNGTKVGTTSDVKATLTRTRSKHLKPGQKQSFKAARAMHFVLLTILGSNLTRNILEQLLIFIGGNSDYACDKLIKLMMGLTGLSIHGGLVFLWLRQYVFYTNPLLRKIRPKSLKLISISTYVDMVITALLCLVLQIWWRDFTSFNGVCRPAPGSRRVPAWVPYGVLVFSTVTIQLSLTFLFIYPIVTHNKQMKSYKNREDDNTPEDSQSNSRSTKRLIKCVKRALLAATVGITTDIVGALIAIWLPEGMPIFALSILYEVDVLLNIFCLFYTYVYWRDIIFPWRTTKYTLKQPSKLLRS